MQGEDHAGRSEGGAAPQPRGRPAERYWSAPSGDEPLPGPRNAEREVPERVASHGATEPDAHAGAADDTAEKKPRRRWWRRAIKG